MMNLFDFCLMRKSQNKLSKTNPNYEKKEQKMEIQKSESKYRRNIFEIYSYIYIYLYIRNNNQILLVLLICGPAFFISSIFSY